MMGKPKKKPVGKTSGDKNEGKNSATGETDSLTEAKDKSQKSDRVDATQSAKASPRISQRINRKSVAKVESVPSEENDGKLTEVENTPATPAGRARSRARRGSSVGSQQTPKSGSKTSQPSQNNEHISPEYENNVTNDNDLPLPASEKETPKSRKSVAASRSKSSAQGQSNKTNNKSSTPRNVSLTETPKDKEFATPKSKATPQAKRSSVKAKSKTSKAKTSGRNSAERNRENITVNTQDDMQMDTSEESVKQEDNNSEEVPMDTTESAPQTPVNQIMSTPQTGGRSRRSAAVKARKSFQNLSKGFMYDEDENEGDKVKGKQKKNSKAESDDDSDADPDVKIEEEESSSEDNYSGEPEESSEGSAEEESDEYEENGNGRLKTTKKADSEMPYPDTSDGRLLGTIQAFYDFYLECERSDLFCTWRPKPSHWKPLSKSDMEPYLPSMKTSPRFTMAYSKSNKKGTESTMNLFESQSNRDYKVCYTGGPIRAMSWCPVPLKNKSADQVLALYAVHQPDFRHTPQELLEIPSLIQIWKFGKEMKEPAMWCGLAFDCGPVHELKWCPFGVYDSPEAGKETQYHSRLGLLAAAAADGLVYIFSIPHQLPKSDEDAYPIFRCLPVAKLVTSLFSVKGSYGPCMCIDWQWRDSACRIFAGFGLGHVAIYQLDTESAFLHKKTDDGVDLIAPIISIPCHRDAVTSIAICQNVPDYFTTVSHDRFIKVWDLKRPEAILNQQYRSIFFHATWPVQLSSIMFALDYGPGNFSIFESGYFGTKGKPVVPHMDTVWHLNYSPWLRACASVDGDGAVAMTIMPNLLVHRIHSGIYKHSGHVVSVKAKIESQEEETEPQVTIKENAESTEVAGQGNDDPKTDLAGQNSTENGTATATEIKQETSTEVLVKSRASFEELHNTCHLTFKIDTIKDFTKLKRDRFKLVHDMRNLPIQAVYRTAWNPNLHWRTWLAFGGQAGILGLVNFHWHDDKIALKLSKKIT